MDRITWIQFNVKIISELNVQYLIAKNCRANSAGVRLVMWTLFILTQNAISAFARNALLVKCKYVKWINITIFTTASKWVSSLLAGCCCFFFLQKEIFRFVFVDKSRSCFAIEIQFNPFDLFLRKQRHKLASQLSYAYH